MIRKTVIAAAAGAAVFSGILSGTANVKRTSAYFTDQTSKTNIYTFGDITADGTETEWKPEEAWNLLPEETAEKNPNVVNTGANAAVVFIVLDSPCAAGLRTAAEDGSLQDTENKELFEYLTYGDAPGFEEHWLLLETEYTDASGTVIAKEGTAMPEDAGAVRRIFGYRDSLPGKTGETFAGTELCRRLRAGENRRHTDPFSGSTGRTSFPRKRNDRPFQYEKYGYRIAEGNLESHLCGRKPQ